MATKNQLNRQGTLVVVERELRVRSMAVPRGKTYIEEAIAASAAEVRSIQSISNSYISTIYIYIYIFVWQ